MQPYIVVASQRKPIRLNEQDRVTSILQNISMILQTKQESVPLYREFGLPMEFLDRPMPVAKQMILIETREAIMKYEPRAELVSVKYSQDPAGIMRLEAEVNIPDE